MNMTAPRRRLHFFSRTAALLLTATVAAAACTGGGGDDDDVVPSPSPTPAFNADGCQIAWIDHIDGAPSSVVDVFLLDAPVAAWTVGSHGWGSPATGRFFHRFDTNTSGYDYRAIVTSGAYTMLFATTTAGNFVQLADDVAQPVYLLDTAGSPAALAGTSGTGTFEGFLSDPYAANVTPAQGDFSIMVGTTAFSLGGDLSYAICYEGAAPLKPARGSR